MGAARTPDKGICLARRASDNDLGACVILQSMKCLAHQSVVLFHQFGLDRFMVRLGPLLRKGVLQFGELHWRGIRHVVQILLRNLSIDVVNLAEEGTQPKRAMRRAFHLHGHKNLEDAFPGGIGQR